MLKTQFDYLCKTYGDQTLAEKDRWKAIKYIYNENPLIDVQRALKENTILYIDNQDIGPGFYILEAPYAFSIPTQEDRVVTFIPLYLIDKISFVSDFINQQPVANTTVKRLRKNPEVYEGVSTIKEEETAISSIIE